MLYNLILYHALINALSLTNSLSYEVMKVEVLSHDSIYLQKEDGQYISARVTIPDTQGREQAKVERSWKGQSLYITFNKVTYKDKTLYFPDTISSNEKTINKTSHLYLYYLENKECLLLAENASANRRHALYKVAMTLSNPLFILRKKFYKQQTISLNDCKIGSTYSIYIDTNYSLVLKEE